MFGEVGLTTAVRRAKQGFTLEDLLTTGLNPETRTRHRDNPLTASREGGGNMARKSTAHEGHLHG
jgi:hypothetical protein